MMGDKNTNPAQNLFVWLLDIVKKTFWYIENNWKSIVVIGPAVLAVYYFIGALLVENIDKNLKFEATKHQNGYEFIQAGADLIKREIDDHMFTPNLPFIFPAFILDNMPSFQKGIIKSISNAVHSAAEAIKTKELSKADTFLKYPPNVWLFSKTKDFKLEPSSTAQYRKARKNLLAFNETITVNENLPINVLKGIKKDLEDIEEILQKNITSHTSLKADNVFYEAQGRLYADYILIKTIQKDLVTSNLSLLKPFEQAIALDPSFVRNGKIGSTWVPNHLFELAYYTLISRMTLSEWIRSLKDVD